MSRAARARSGGTRERPLKSIKAPQPCDVASARKSPATIHEKTAPNDDPQSVIVDSARRVATSATRTSDAFAFEASSSMTRQ